MSKKNIMVTEDTLYAAFRYYLGRMTMATHDFVHELQDKVPELTFKTTGDMIMEIETAIKTGNAGMSIDVVVWSKLLVNLKKSLKNKPA
jgi:hypothetical protein